MATSSHVGDSPGGQKAFEAKYAYMAFILPKGTTATFLNEGAANVIYKITTPYTSQSQETFEKYLNILPLEFREQPYNLAAEVWKTQKFKLLRIRKDLKYTTPTFITYANFINLIQPLFEEHEILHYDLVDLRESNVVEGLNSELHQWEAASTFTNPFLPAFARDSRRRGIYLSREPYGLLVKDMSPPVGFTLVEFKPKWLKQSPAALPGSKRCRTCAKRARDAAIQGKRPAVDSFCPLDLTSMDYEILIRPAKAILKIQTPQNQQQIQRLYQFCDWIRRSNSIIHKLAKLQGALDKKGVFAADPQDEAFLTAMTLRDCSLFVQIPNDPQPDVPNGGYVARLGDLDVKSALKVDYWKAVEKPLIDEGWYMGTEKEELRQPLDCGLYPAYWTSESKGRLLVLPR